MGDDWEYRWECNVPITEDPCTPEHPHGSYVRCRWVLPHPPKRRLAFGHEIPDHMLRPGAVLKWNGTFFDPS